MIPPGLEKITLSVVTVWQDQEAPENQLTLNTRSFSRLGEAGLSRIEPRFSAAACFSLRWTQGLCATGTLSPINVKPHPFPQFKNMHHSKIKLYHIIWASHLLHSCKITIPLLPLAWMEEVWHGKDTGLSLISFFLIDLFQDVRKQILSLRCWHLRKSIVYLIYGSVCIGDGEGSSKTNCQGKKNMISLICSPSPATSGYSKFTEEYPCLSHGLINLEGDWAGGGNSKYSRNTVLWSWHNSFLISNSSCTHPWTTQMFKWDVWRYWEIIINLNSFVSIYFHILQKTVIFFPKFPLEWGGGLCCQNGAGSGGCSFHALRIQAGQGLSWAL